MTKWTMEHVACLFMSGGFEAIAGAHNAECGSSKIVAWHPPAAEDKGIEGIDFPDLKLTTDSSSNRNQTWHCGGAVRFVAG